MFKSLGLIISDLFILKNKFNYPYLLSTLVFLIYFSILSTVIGTFVLNMSLVLFCIIFLIFYAKNKKEIGISLNFKIFYLLIIFLSINSVFSDHFLHTAKSSLNLIKNVIFLIGCYFIFKMDKKIFHRFITLVFIIFAFTAFDTILQYIIGRDIFGYPQSELHYGRLSGPFGDELIVGSFLSKITFISILYFLINFKNKYYDLFFLIFTVLLVLITKERSASLMVIFTSIIYIIFRIENFKLKIIVLIMTLSLISSSLMMVPDTLKRFQFMYNTEKSFFDTQWGAHFLTSYEIFKKNPLIGSGIRTYRYECSKDYLKKINSKAVDLRCSTHPHNFYFEILSETGGIGFFSFLFFLLLVFKKILSSLNEKISQNKIYISYCLFFFFFWPIKTTGSIFASWNSYFYILALIVIFYQTNFIKFKNK
jgi:O-antigen ligase